MLRRTRILVVDDDEDIQKIFKKRLEGAGYHVVTAKNGREAIEKTESEFYNLVLIELKLPDMEGTALLEHFNDGAPRMIKIIVTGSPTLNNAIDAINKGADGFILKPVKMDNLLEIIKKHLKKQSEEIKFTEKKVEEFIEERARQLETLIKYHRPIGG